MPSVDRPPHADHVPELGVYLDAAALVLPTIRVAMDGRALTPNAKDGNFR